MYYTTCEFHYNPYQTSFDQQLVDGMNDRIFPKHFDFIQSLLFHLDEDTLMGEAVGAYSIYNKDQTIGEVAQALVSAYNQKHPEAKAVYKDEYFVFPHSSISPNITALKKVKPEGHSMNLPALLQDFVRNVSIFNWLAKDTGSLSEKVDFKDSDGLWWFEAEETLAANAQRLIQFFDSTFNGAVGELALCPQTNTLKFSAD